MKMTIVTDDQGNILGAVQGESLSEKKDGVEASVAFAEGYQTHVVDIDDDIGAVTDVVEFQKRLQQQLQAQHGKP